MVNFDNFGGLKSVLKFHIYIFSSVKNRYARIRLICEELVRIFSDVKNWYLIFTNVENLYQILTRVKNRYTTVKRNMCIEATQSDDLRI